MEGLLAATVVMVIVLILLALTLNKYAAFWYKMMVADPFETINFIMTTEEVPARWRIRFIETLVRRNRSSAFERAVRWLLVKWYVYRLDRLMYSIKINSLIKSQDKLEYKEAFQEIRAAWKDSPDLF